MTPEQFERVNELFDRAKDLSADERNSLLAAEKLDAEVRAKVLGMLERHDETAGIHLLDSTTLVNESSGNESAGQSIGPYKLIERIGAGSFGDVYMADQREPVRRLVAIKILKPGMDTRAVISRFKQERQALAMMDHPNIAKVFDAGTTPTGRPYFVMELVRGQPITKYCDENHLTIVERLELFSQVCHAVQHAHQKAVIHRDLKPSNMLVSTVDGKPQAKVIDFGIAKTPQLTDLTLHTHTESHRAIGTPAYMSPEQAAGSLDIDPRTDIYSLGGVLYELLTGEPPLDAHSLCMAAHDAMRRIIREVEPPKPSTRLSKLTDALPRLAALRRIEPHRLGRLIHGDLDYIVMMCLEKDRKRRYETAGGLAEDIGNYLSSKPVFAGPGGAFDHLTKFFRWHRGTVNAGSFVIGALVLGIIGTTAGMIWARRDQARAEKQREKAERIAGFMEATLSGVSLQVAHGRDGAMLKEMMDNAADRIQRGEMQNAPEAELRLRLVIGDVYRQLSFFDASERILAPAIDLASRTLGPPNDQVARTLGEKLKTNRGGAQPTSRAAPGLHDTDAHEP